MPVGARIRVFSPRAMAGQPNRCGAVGCSKTARNQDAVTGWKSSRALVVAGRSLFFHRHNVVLQGYRLLLGFFGLQMGCSPFTHPL